MRSWSLLCLLASVITSWLGYCFHLQNHFDMHCMKIKPAFHLQNVYDFYTILRRTSISESKKSGLPHTQYIPDNVSHGRMSDSVYNWRSSTLKQHYQILRCELWGLLKPIHVKLGPRRMRSKPYVC